MDLQEYYAQHGGSLTRNPALTYGEDYDFYGFDLGSLIGKIGEVTKKVTANLPAISVTGKKGTFSSGPKGLQWTSLPTMPKISEAEQQALIQQQAAAGPDLIKWLPLAIPLALFFLKK